MNSLAMQRETLVSLSENFKNYCYIWIIAIYFVSESQCNLRFMMPLFMRSLFPGVVYYFKFYISYLFFFVGKGGSRRELGHGALAERALRQVLLPDNQFTVRLVSSRMSVDRLLYSWSFRKLAFLFFAKLLVLAMKFYFQQKKTVELFPNYR